MLPSVRREQGAEQLQSRPEPAETIVVADMITRPSGSAEHRTPQDRVRGLAVNLTDLVGTGQGTPMKTTLAIGALCLAVQLGASPVRADTDSDPTRPPIESVKDAGKKVGHATRDASRKIGHAFRDAAREIGHASRDAWNESADSRHEAGEEAKEVSESAWQSFKCSLRAAWEQIAGSPDSEAD